MAVGTTAAKVAGLLAEGKSTTEIAAELGRAKSTIGWHIKRLGVEGSRDYCGRRAIMTTLGGAGLRASELCDVLMAEVRGWAARWPRPQSQPSRRRRAPGRGRGSIVLPHSARRRPSRTRSPAHAHPGKSRYRSLDRRRRWLLLGAGSVVAHGDRRVSVQVPRDLLGDDGEDLLGSVLACDQRRHATQRRFLAQPGTQRALKALVLERQRRRRALDRMAGPFLHGKIVPPIQGTQKAARGATVRHRSARDLEEGS
jgi:hypothetical protein